MTGATGLLGIKHAEAIAEYGGNPILLDLSQESVNDLSQRINKNYGVISKGYKVDITDEKMLQDNVHKVLRSYGKIDGLVNNAANNPQVNEYDGVNFSRLENFPIDIWNKDLAVGLTGAFLCAKYYGYEISRNPNGGSIVNISSDLGIIAPDQRLYSDSSLKEEEKKVKPVSYSVVKTGIIGLTKYLSTYWAHRNVRCNAICPGGVYNDQPKEFLDKVHKRIPLNRLANPYEYQGTLIWMLSNSSSYLNGAVISVDGGRTAW